MIYTKLNFHSILHDDNNGTTETLISEFKGLRNNEIENIEEVQFVGTIQLVQVIGNNKYYSIRFEVDSSGIDEFDHHSDFETAVNIFHTVIDLYRNNNLS